MKVLDTDVTGAAISNQISRLRHWLRPTPLNLAMLAALATIGALLRVAHYFNYRRPTDFIQMGEYFASPAGIGGLATSHFGYDGQFFYYIARFPGDMRIAVVDAPALRYSRMLYPLLARIFSLGQSDLIAWMLLAINVVAIAATVALLAWVLRERNLSIWPALAPGLYCGQALAATRDLGDPFAIFWLALALAFLQRRRWLAVAASLGFGMLTRESTLLFAFCFAVPLVLERGWKLLAAFAAIVFGPYFAWEWALYRVTGVWGVHSSSQVNTFVLVPFSGLSAVPRQILLIEIVLFVCLPITAAFTLGLVRLVSRRREDMFTLVVALSAVFYALAVALQPGIHWMDRWEPTRLAAPIALLLPLLTAPAPKLRPVRVGALALVLLSYSMAIV